MSLSDSADLVFDVGAHKGEDSDFYLRLGFRVVAVEAHPGLAQHLKTRFRKEIDDGRYVLIDKAIGEAEGEITFYVNKKVSVWGTTDPHWAERNRQLGADSEEIRVRCIRFADIIRTHGCPHYLKVDVEGLDMHCVKALSEVSCRPKYLSLESTKISWQDLRAEFDTLEALGYSRFKVVNQKAHAGGRFEGRDGQTVAYEFEDGATGPFGANLKGEWLSREQAIRRYIPIFILYKILGDNTFLQKVLRNIPGVRGVVRRAVGWYDTHAMQE